MVAIFYKRHTEPKAIGVARLDRNLGEFNFFTRIG